MYTGCRSYIPEEIAADERTYITFILQNALDVPADFKIMVEAPKPFSNRLGTTPS